MFFKLALDSMRYRSRSIILSLLAVFVAIYVLMAVEHVRYQTKVSFTKTASGIDLIVGPKTSEMNLLLAGVFGIGEPEGSLRWQSYQKFSHHPAVAWSIPLAIGDSHRGFKVLGTSNDYFEHLTFAGGRASLSFARGGKLAQKFDAVLGAEVANSLGYSVGSELTLSHGTQGMSFIAHEQHPFKVVGVLNATGSPTDHGIFVGLEGLEAVHGEGAHASGIAHGNSEGGELASEAEAHKISLFFLGLKARNRVFLVQAAINNATEEALRAVMPGVALAQLWKMSANLEKVLALMSNLVLFAALLGMSAMLLATLRERRSEIATLRILGARPVYVFALIQLEALVITASATALALVCLSLSVYLAAGYMAQHYGLYLSPGFDGMGLGGKIIIIMTCSALVSAVPAYSAYRLAEQ